MPESTETPAANPDPAAGSLVEILTLEARDDDCWLGHSPRDTGRPDIYGGQVASQCLRAAGFTVPSTHVPNSVHCYFLRRGRPDLPIEMRVERLRTGRTYATRRVEAAQGGKVVFGLISSFHGPEPGREFDPGLTAVPPAPDPSQVETEGPVWSAPFESAPVHHDGVAVRWWARAKEDLDDDPMLHFCALLFASDMHAGGAAMGAAGLADGRRLLGPDETIGANLGSLDHSVWFHRPPRLDEWVLFESEPVEVRDARGLVLGGAFDLGGRRLATLSQEMFLKLGAPPVSAG